MKITPIAAPSVPTQQAQTPSPSIKMSVNRTVHRDIEPKEMIKEVISQTESPNSDINVEANPAEEMKPISPQLAMIAKAKRALQVKERELAEREAKLASQGVQTTPDDLMAKLKASPLSVLQEAGVTYEDLTEAILSNPQSPELLQLKNEMKALKEELTQQFTSRDTQAEEQITREWTDEATRMASEGETYQFIREAEMVPDVIEGIKEHWQKTGELKDLTETMNKLEQRLVDNALKASKIGKVQALLNPQASLEEPQAMSTPQAPQRQMRTLTSKDNARPSGSDRKTRAMAAFWKGSQ